MSDDVRRTALARCGYDDTWFDERSAAVGQTVLNVYQQLRAHDLWRFVKTDVSTNVGNLEFVCDDARALRACLTHHPSFSSPAVAASGAWQSRELKPRFSLHVKHFAGWPQDQVQVHIDRIGAWPPRWYWLCPPLTVWHGLRHLVDYNGYQRVFSIAEALQTPHRPPPQGPHD